MGLKTKVKALKRRRKDKVGRLVLFHHSAKMVGKSQKQRVNIVLHNIRKRLLQ
jgi:hypothetical protein